MGTERFEIDTNAIEADLLRIIELSKTEYNTIEYKKLAFSLIDLTTLNATDTVEHVIAFTDKVNRFGANFDDMDNVAAICVYPNLAQTVADKLELVDVQIAAVAGGFPSSMTFPEIKIAEAKMAIEAGADEIDIVLSLSSFLAGNYEACHNEIVSIKKAIGEAHLKVILETGALGSAENIWRASVLAINAGADFIKTSTGKIEPAATFLAAYVMCKAIDWHFENCGERIGFKPAGGIATTSDALVYLAIVGELLGKEWLTPSLFRIGASRLSNNLLTEINGKEIIYF